MSFYYTVILSGDWAHFATNEVKEFAVPSVESKNELRDCLTICSGRQRMEKSDNRRSALWESNRFFLGAGISESAESRCYQRILGFESVSRSWKPFMAE